MFKRGDRVRVIDYDFSYEGIIVKKHPSLEDYYLMSRPGHEEEMVHERYLQMVQPSPEMPTCDFAKLKKYDSPFLKSVTRK